MRTVNTSELTGEPLNWAVGKAEGLPLQIQPAQYGIPARVFEEAPSGLVRYRPIVEWMQCGPLVDKYEIETYYADGFGRVACRRYTGAEQSHPTCLRTAICRAVVSAVSGPTVDVPEALL